MEKINNCNGNCYTIVSKIDFHFHDIFIKSRPIFIFYTVKFRKNIQKKLIIIIIIIIIIQRQLVRRRTWRESLQGRLTIQTSQV